MTCFFEQINYESNLQKQVNGGENFSHILHYLYRIDDHLFFKYHYLVFHNLAYIEINTNLFKINIRKPTW